MVLSVLLFGPERAALGRSRVEVTVSEGAGPAEILRALAEQAPALAPLLRSGRIAINGAFAPPDARAAPGDEVALIGLVSGG
ncbi:MAG: MoaD/ThiS family protein [Phycisphaerales bacterium]